MYSVHKDDKELLLLLLYVSHNVTKNHVSSHGFELVWKLLLLSTAFKQQLFSILQFLLGH